MELETKNLFQRHNISSHSLLIPIMDFTIQQPRSLTTVLTK